nr:MAG TPA: hypothetical protein [Caudoviricetes sp.]
MRQTAPYPRIYPAQILSSYQHQLRPLLPPACPAAAGSHDGADQPPRYRDLWRH